MDSPECGIQYRLALGSEHADPTIQRCGATHAPANQTSSTEASSDASSEGFSGKRSSALEATGLSASIPHFLSNNTRPPTQMQFLRTGQEIRNKIDELISSPHSSPVLMAVAYWGTGSDEYGSKAQRIICDLESGSYDPSVIRQLLEATPGSVRMNKNFHAKVVITSAGAVISSANMSDNGLGLHDRMDSRNHEAGYFIDESNLEHKAVTQWFEDHWNVAQEINEAALDAAKLAWSKRQPQKSAPEVRNEIDPHTLLQPGYQGDSVMQSVKESIREQCRKQLTGVAQQLVGKIASAAVYLILNADGQSPQYRVNSGDSTSSARATDTWIAEHVRKMDKAHGERRVSILLNAFADGAITISDTQGSAAIQSAASAALSKLPWHSIN